MRHTLCALAIVLVGCGGSGGDLPGRGGSADVIAQAADGGGDVDEWPYEYEGYRFVRELPIVGTACHARDHGVLVLPGRDASGSVVDVCVGLACFGDDETTPEGEGTVRVVVIGDASETDCDGVMAPY